MIIGSAGNDIVLPVDPGSAPAGYKGIQNGIVNDASGSGIGTSSVPLPHSIEYVCGLYIRWRACLTSHNREGRRRA